MLRFLASLFVVCSTLPLMTSCAGKTKSAGTTLSATAEDSSDLTWAEAQDRKARLSEVTYDLKVDLMSAITKDVETNFSGDITIHFQLKDKTKNLRLDFFEGEVQALVVNGKNLPLAQKKKYWIELPAANLVQGANEVRIRYSHAYSRTGEGLHRFIDPADSKVYLYTQFESFDANKFMPCFDQPDLRSELSMTVLAPKDWLVVSGAIEKSKKISGAGQLWVFQPTEKIATYLFSLHAGPYAVFSDTYKRADKTTMPLRILVRPSLKKYLKEADWFKTTKDGVAFYESYFGARYPFGKLDQLVVPEFNMGGMENVGAITYTENILPRAPLTRKLRRGISGLLLHEIAHMWFGDLVTMAWWNNLWLNESFATYMSALAQSEATEYKEVWQTFGGSVKARAYVEDAMITTHPIEAPINTVKEAATNFDAITYNKGASVLKQLNFFMTADAFKAGIQDYFKTYALQNTTLGQFIGSLQKHTDKDLNQWADRWLRQSGADTIAADWTCSGDRLKTISVKLETLAGRKARPQSVEVGLYKTNSGQVIEAAKVRAEFGGASGQQTATIGGDWTCPDFVYPNHGDHGYVLVKLDPKSLAFLDSGISKVGDALTRSLVWSDLWRMVRDTEISLKTYVDIVTKNFAAENDEIVLRQVLSTISGWGGSTLDYWPTASAQSKAERAAFVATMEKEFLRRLKLAVSASDDEKLWYDAFLQIAETPAATDQLYKWYQAGFISKKFPLDVERGWGIAKTLSRYSHPQAAKVLAEMKKKDGSDRGLKNALAAEAVAPQIDVKKKWVTQFTGDSNAKGLSLDEAHTVLWSLFPVEQRPAKLTFANDFFAYLAKNRKSEDTSRVGAVLGTLIPLDCSAAVSKSFKEKVGAYSDIDPSFKKNFLMSLEEDERCQRVRARSSL